MARKFNAEVHIIDLNNLKNKLNYTPITSITFREELKDCGIPSNVVFWKVFRESGLIDSVGEDLYRFKNPKKPIHYTKLNEIYQRYKEKTLIYRDAWCYKKKQRDVLERSDIQAAIKLLTENGLEVVLRIDQIFPKF